MLRTANPWGSLALIRIFPPTLANHVKRCHHNVHLRHECQKCINTRWVCSRRLRDRVLGARLCPRTVMCCRFDCLPRGVSALTPPRTFHPHVRVVRFSWWCVDGVCTLPSGVLVVCMHSTRPPCLERLSRCCVSVTPPHFGIGNLIRFSLRSRLTLHVGQY